MSEPLSLAKYPYVHGNPVNATDPSGLLAYDTSAAINIFAILAVSSLVSRNVPVATIRREDSDNIVVPGYLKDINHRGVETFLSIPIRSEHYQVVREKVEECNGTQGADNCDLEGFPVIVWGLSDTTITEAAQHTRDAIVQTGQSFLAYIAPGWNEWSGPASPPNSGGPISWYNAVQGPCQWISGVYQPQFNNRDCDEYSLQLNFARWTAKL
ncbi:RHS repeat-associated core domain-containing protein [Oscillatoria salina]|uniref:hypothetical protein n=1 Tax=Oscillatoria salina TaxID=331517 RepID=UPI001CCC38C1|nr:hypothetical protein [Oscillatoria salina]MBZ8178553.1 hypothetical protein [Oscillatoria salina IIICB1]